MKKALLSLLFACFCTLILAQDATTFILVRHAEKAADGTRNPPLNEAGEARTQLLAEMLSSQSVDALYATPFKRTTSTLQPLAEKLGMDISPYDPADGKAWLDTLLEKHRGGTLVIAGHSNTVPVLANALLDEERFQQFDDNDYSNLIIIMVDADGNGKLVQLRF